MNKRKKTTRPFSLILDDIIRSPRISSSEYRLYSLLISYCAKTDELQVCEVSKRLLASHMGISIRGVTKIIRRLEDEKLIVVNYGSKQKPSYTLNTTPPESICPTPFKGRRIKSAINYISEQGGVREFQKRKRKTVVKKSRRTGWPQSGKKSSSGTPESSDDNPMVPSLIDSSGELEFTTQKDSDSQTHELQFMPPMNSSSPPHELQFMPPMNSSSSRYRVNTESSLERPNGLIHSGDCRHLVDRNPSPENLPAGRNEAHRVRRAAPNEEDIVMAKPTKEQLEAERARLSAQKRGTREKVTDLKTAESKPSKANQRAISDADVSSSGKLTPGELYTRFRNAVWNKYPNAILAKHTDGRYMAWGKHLTANYSEDALVEMIKLLVLDYENLGATRIFFKFSGTPHPTYEQFNGNIDLLAARVGIGITAPPSVRFSPYADDYAKRKNKSTEGERGADGGKSVDPIQAIRDRVNG